MIIYKPVSHQYIFGSLLRAHHKIPNCTSIIYIYIYLYIYIFEPNTLKVLNPDDSLHFFHDDATEDAEDGGGEEGDGSGEKSGSRSSSRKLMGEKQEKEEEVPEYVKKLEKEKQVGEGEFGRIVTPYILSKHVIQTISLIKQQ